MVISLSRLISATASSKVMSLPKPSLGYCFTQCSLSMGLTMWTRVSFCGQGKMGCFTTLPDWEQTNKVRDMLFADDASIATHTEEELQYLMDRLSVACKELFLSLASPRQKQTKNTVPRLIWKAFNYNWQIWARCSWRFSLPWLQYLWISFSRLRNQQEDR